MRKTIFALFLALMVAVPFASAADISVQVNGNQVPFPDQKPFIDGGRTFVPLRFVSQALGGSVDWEGSTQIATVDRAGVHVAMQIGSKSPMVNGQAKGLDAPARLTNGRTMVPLRFVSEALGASVEWVADTRTVVITDNGGTVNTGNTGNGNATPDNNDTSTGDSRWPDKVKKLIPGGGGTVTGEPDTTPPEPWGEY